MVIDYRSPNFDYFILHGMILIYDLLLEVLRN